jgi:TPR repeat protein
MGKMGVSNLDNDYRIEFHSKGNRVAAKLFHKTQKITSCPLEDEQPMQPKLTYETLTSSARAKIDHLLSIQGISLEPKRVSLQEPQELDVQMDNLFISASRSSSPAASSSAFLSDLSYQEELRTPTFPKQGIKESSMNSLELQFQEIWSKSLYGNPIAIYEMGCFYEWGIGTPMDKHKAEACYDSALNKLERIQRRAEKGDSRAQFIWGRIHDKGQRVLQSDTEAVKWYTKSAEQGDAFAQGNLGFMYQEGRGVLQSDTEAVKWYTKSAEQGDAFAQGNLGFMYQEGRGVLQSDTEALKWFSKAAEQGDVSGQINLGLMYEQGRGVLQSDTEALKWFSKAAEQGDALGQINLGLMYLKGRGVLQSDTEALKWFSKAAEQGDALGQNNLGLMYEKNRGVLQSDTEAVKWFSKAAEQGNASGQNNLGLMYLKGRGVLQNDTEAVKWFSKAAEQGNVLGQINLGLMYEQGRGVLQSDTEAVKWFSKAAEQGDASGQFCLGLMYEQGRGVLQSDTEAVKWFSKAAEQGDASGQFNLGLMYEQGRGVLQSDTEALKWYTKAAEQGDATGQFCLGLMYLKGRGVLQSDTEAVKWFSKAAEQGDVLGQINLGLMYEQGRGVLQSDIEAVKWFSKAAEQGNASGQNNLGLMYEQGRGVLQSDTEAVKWYTKAAEQGDATGQFCLGLMYEQGRGVLQSDTEAVKWYTKAAEQGDATGQFCLGLMYEKGRGVLQSDTEALKWYTKAAEQGDASGQFCLDLMYEKSLGAQQSNTKTSTMFSKDLEWLTTPTFLQTRLSLALLGFSSKNSLSRLMTQRGKKELLQSLRGKPSVFTELEILDSPLRIQNTQKILHAPKPSNFPLPDEYFTGRKKELEAIHALCTKNQRIAISGLAGIGKTTLSIKYANDYQKSYQFIYFLSATPSAKIAEEFSKLADYLNVPQGEPDRRMLLLKKKLDQFQKNYLIILDGVDSADIFEKLKTYLPEKSGCFLLSTQHFECASSLNFVPIELLPFKLEDATKYLIRASKQDSDSSPLNDDSGQPTILIEKLGRHPLALSCAAKYIRSHGISFEKYTELFEKYQTQLFMGDLHETNEATRLSDAITVLKAKASEIDKECIEVNEKITLIKQALADETALSENLLEDLENFLLKH